MLLCKKKWNGLKIFIYCSEPCDWKNNQEFKKERWMPRMFFLARRLFWIGAIYSWCICLCCVTKAGLGNMQVDFQARLNGISGWGEWQYNPTALFRNSIRSIQSSAVTFESDDMMTSYKSGSCSWRLFVKSLVWWCYCWNRDMWWDTLYLCYRNHGWDWWIACQRINEMRKVSGSHCWWRREGWNEVG